VNGRIHALRAFQACQGGGVRPSALALPSVCVGGGSWQGWNVTPRSRGRGQTSKAAKPEAPGATHAEKLRAAAPPGGAKQTCLLMNWVCLLPGKTPPNQGVHKPFTHAVLQPSSVSVCHVAEHIRHVIA